jgi:transcriptional regulator with PAS, ATPase and Fis domain
MDQQLAPAQLVAESAAFQAVAEVATGIASRSSTIMLLGETGTGKECLARLIHRHSPRARKPFIPVDCSALSESLFESELFGHLRGAFTGAIRDSLGCIRAADGGTLFLDEIGELPLLLQSKLLRVLQERTVRPVGDTRSHPVDVRVICATNRNLEEMVHAGTFRQDLYYRLNVVAITVPPVRQRLEDVIPLARHFLDIQAALYQEPIRMLSPEARQILRDHDWPGNVRELANAMEHAHVLCTTGTIRPQDLPLHLQRSAGHRRSNGAGGLQLEAIERQTIAEALRRTRYCKTSACRLLGINVQRLNRRITKLQIPLPQH